MEYITIYLNVQVTNNRLYTQAHTLKNSDTHIYTFSGTRNSQPTFTHNIYRRTTDWQKETTTNTSIQKKKKKKTKHKKKKKKKQQQKKPHKTGGGGETQN